MGDFVGMGIIAVAVGSAAIGAGRKVLDRWRARRELRDKLPLGASSAEGTVVRITGEVQALDETITAPLSGRTCVVARSTVRSGLKLTAYAVQPREAITMTPFIIDRGAEGRVLVEGKHVLLDLAPIRTGRKKFEWARCSQFLVTQGLRVGQHSRAIFEEQVVEPGMRVSVVGLLMKDLPAEPASDELGFRETAAPNLRLAGNVEHPLVIGEPVD